MEQIENTITEEGCSSMEEVWIRMDSFFSNFIIYFFLLLYIFDFVRNQMESFGWVMNGLDLNW